MNMCRKMISGVHNDPTGRELLKYRHAMLAQPLHYFNLPMNADWVHRAGPTLTQDARLS